ncbi:DUF4255 domain-containing protein [Actinokineospora iranica]|uniref:Pvc16 N-terminal domain-containing protein n=1 Tax=Actinokineospora iranica TaxID=1271860 RepID=A0A1G6S2R4_9PSEU|nr:DUF4255 domain-containing protein [Actinokineospora iranica]SDD10486.1 Protein of unknown function [Actinokineospora iranica]
MLHLLDESLEEFLRAEVPLPRSEIDIVFAAPDKEWSARVSRPTVNLYLWDVRRNLSARDLGVETVRDADGRVRQRPPLPQVDCRYLITGWTSDIGDEHALLGATMAALPRVPELDDRYLHEAYRAVKPIPKITLAAGGAGENSDFWSASAASSNPAWTSRPPRPSTSPCWSPRAHRSCATPSPPPPTAPTPPPACSSAATAPPRRAP